MRLIVISVSAGAGHVRAAQALEAAAARRGCDISAVHVDAMELVPKLFRKLYAESYVALINAAPALWSWLYRATDKPKAADRVTRIRQAIERLNTRRLIQRLRELDGDAVICTHFLPAQLLSRLIRRGEWDRPVFVQVTDYDVHGLWVHDHLNGYFAADEEIAWRMADRGLEPQHVHVTGIPIHPVFAEPRERAVCAAELGLDPRRPTILLMSGGHGVGDLSALAERLLALTGPHQLIALAGRNTKLLERLRTLAAAHPGRLLPLGFTATIERVMTCADLAVSKPGGLTTAECLAVGLPLIVVSPIPGQEERNMHYLMEGGAAWQACDGAALAFRVQRLLAEPERLRTMAANARRLGRADAAQRVLDVVLADGGRRRTS